MIYKIAIKSGVIFANGCGETVDFKTGYDSIETFTSQEEFDARLAQLRGDA